jgi:uncharacterized membrane protein
MKDRNAGNAGRRERKGAKTQGRKGKRRNENRKGVREKGKGWREKSILGHFVLCCFVLVRFLFCFLFSVLVLVLVLVFLCVFASLRFLLPAFPLSLCVRVSV